MDLFERDNALNFLKDQNERQMAALPDELQQVLRSLPVDHAARWLADNLSKYQQHTTEKPVLPENTKRMLEGMSMSEDEYLGLVQKFTPKAHDQLPVTTVTTTEDQPVQLTDLQKEYARRFGLTEDEYRANMRKAGQ